MELTSMAMQTKAEQVEIKLRKEILSGRWIPGQLLPGEMEMLSDLGVSRITVRQALGVLASEGLIVRKKSAGTFVAQKALKTGIIAITAVDRNLTSKTGYSYQHMIEVAKKNIDGVGYRTVLAIGHGGTDQEFMSSITLLDRANRGNILGVLDTANNPLLLQRLEEEGICTVSISIPVAISKYGVVLSYESMTQLAKETLNAHGIDDFALMDVEYPKVYAQDGTIDMGHYQNYPFIMSALDNREDRLISVRRSPNREDAYTAFVEWWKRPNRPRAIFFYDDALCDVATRAILDLGIKVPEELSIITHSNVGKTFHFPIPLTRLEFDLDEVMELAWNMLYRLVIHLPIDKPVIYVKPKLIEGASLR
jgi:DNA-binding LacI/PurR family transcriptional regulator